jgi:hypothetical protein
MVPAGGKQVPIDGYQVYFQLKDSREGTRDVKRVPINAINFLVDLGYTQSQATQMTDSAAGFVGVPSGSPRPSPRGAPTSPVVPPHNAGHKGLTVQNQGMVLPQLPLRRASLSGAAGVRPPSPRRSMVLPMPQPLALPVRSPSPRQVPSMLPNAPMSPSSSPRRGSRGSQSLPNLPGISPAGLPGLPGF